jgi:hypothetical protein
MFRHAGAFVDILAWEKDEAYVKRSVFDSRGKCTVLDRSSESSANRDEKYERSANHFLE